MIKALCANLRRIRSIATPLSGSFHCRRIDIETADIRPAGLQQLWARAFFEWRFLVDVLQLPAKAREGAGHVAQRLDRDEIGVRRHLPVPAVVVVPLLAV